MNLTALPESVGKFTALHKLNLDGCKKLTALPESVGDLGALHILDLTGCERLAALPRSISKLTQLDEASCKRVEAILLAHITTKEPSWLQRWTVPGLVIFVAVAVWWYCPSLFP